MNPVVLFTCNEWKAKDSMRLVGVFTNRVKLNDQINTMVKEDRIEGHIDASICTIRELNSDYTYLYVQEIEFNEEI